MNNLTHETIEIYCVDSGSLDYAYYERVARRARAAGFAAWFQGLVKGKKNLSFTTAKCPTCGA